MKPENTVPKGTNQTAGNVLSKGTNQTAGNVLSEGRIMIPEVKICGLKRPEDVEYVNEAGADYAGFVFYEKSSRNVTYEQARKLLARLDSRIRSVAVCVSPDEEALRRMCGLGFDFIQIHGTFSDAYIKTADAGGIPLWRAVNLSFDAEPENDSFSADSPGQQTQETGSPAVTSLQANAAYAFLKTVAEYPKIAGYVVDGARYGGGKTFGWEENEPVWKVLGKVLHQIADGRRVILAGGLTADNVAQGIRIFAPDVVDVSSGVETDGVKDREKINQFIREVRGK